MGKFWSGKVCEFNESSAVHQILVDSACSTYYVGYSLFDNYVLLLRPLIIISYELQSYIEITL